MEEGKASTASEADATLKALGDELLRTLQTACARAKASTAANAAASLFSVGESAQNGGAPSRGVFLVRQASNGTPSRFFRANSSTPNQKRRAPSAPTTAKGIPSEFDFLLAACETQAFGELWARAGRCERFHEASRRLSQFSSASESQIQQAIERESTAAAGYVQRLWASASAELQLDAPGAAGELSYLERAPAVVGVDVQGWRSAKKPPRPERLELLHAESGSRRVSLTPKRPLDVQVQASSESVEAELGTAARLGGTAVTPGASSNSSRRTPKRRAPQTWALADEEGEGAGLWDTGVALRKSPRAVYRPSRRDSAEGVSG